MKKSIILLVIFCGLSLTANAQTENKFNKFWVGGSVGLSIMADNIDGDRDQKTTTYKILPEFGYNFSDRWALGVSVGYSHAEQYAQFYTMYYSIEYKETIKGFNFDIFARFSFLQGSVGKLFLDGDLQCTFGKMEYSEIEAIYDTFLHGALGVRPGVMININDYIAFVGRFGFLGIQSQVTKNDDASDNSITYGLDLDMRQFQLGINITF